MASNHVSRGGCPRCEKAIPFLRAMSRRGRAFQCSGCGTPIIVPKVSVGVAVAAFALLSFLSGRVPGVVIILIIIAAMLFEWLLSPVRIADKPKSDTAVDVA